jgi:methionyl-tRNA formyltransferase
LRVVVITPGSPPHHLHFCVHLTRRHDVVGVVHPTPPRRGYRANIRRLRSQIRRAGPIDFALRGAARLPPAISGWNLADARARAEERHFADARLAYETEVAARAHRVADVNDPASIALIRSLSPDVVVCLGGPIYKRQLIAACGTMINFHSGISPLYNGASTVMFAFANGHVQLCGGTLMTMSAIVDGGDILAHYLPSIEPDDDPAELFMKTVRGAAETTSAFLSYLDEGRRYTGASQTPPLFYYTGSDWTIHHARLVRRHLERRTAAKNVRPERTIRYWDAGTTEDAGARVRATIADLLAVA